MQDSVPLIYGNAWSSAVEGVLDNAKRNFKDYYMNLNGNVPDERGLTDIFLLDPLRKSKVKMLIVSCTI
jgi:hypothetical protein